MTDAMTMLARTTAQQRIQHQYEQVFRSGAQADGHDHAGSASAPPRGHTPAVATSSYSSPIPLTTRRRGARE
jgi:hypothetical protein